MRLAVRQAALWSLAMAKSAISWVLFRLLQLVVALPFTLLILLQIGVAWVLRYVVRCPTDALHKVQAARDKQQSAEAAAAGDAAVAASLLQQSYSDAWSQDSSSSHSHMHVFADLQQGHDSLAWQLVGPYMRAYGRHAIANSQLFNPEYVHFYLPGVGALPYVLVDIWSRAVVVGTGEPLAPRSAWRQITEAFLQEFPGAYFYHITEDFAGVLHDMGYYINGCGTETTLQVQSWKYSGKTRVIRASARSARDSGVRVRELGLGELTDELRHKLEHDVTGCWRARKAVAERELRVFVRHVDFDNMQLQDGVRVFVAEAYEPDQAPPAYVDPVLQGGALNAKPPKPPRRSRSLGKGLTSASSLQQQQQQLKGSSKLSSTRSAPCLPALDTHTTNSSSNSNSSNSLEGSGFSSFQAASSSGGSSGSSGGSSPVSCTARISVLPPRDTAAGGVKFVENFTPCQDDPCKSGQHSAAAAASGADGQYISSSSSGSSGDDDRAAAAGLGPELVGFVLLDPLWEQGQEVGYVASVQRMKRSAHSGTLKLLTEDIISKLRQEGRRELTFGFAPLFNMNDSNGWRYLHWIRWVTLYLYHCANNVYAFKNLAYSKIRYGAGVNQGGRAFNDPNVTLTQVYMASPHYTPGWNILELYGFFAFVGIFDNPISIFLKLMGLKKGGENLE